MDNFIEIYENALSDDLCDLLVNEFEHYHGDYKTYKGVTTGGLHIYDDRKKNVGLVTTGAYSPQFKSGIGYVKFSKKIEWEGKNFFVKNDDNKLYECNVIDLPFFDKNKKLPRKH